MSTIVAVDINFDNVLHEDVHINIVVIVFVLHQFLVQHLHVPNLIIQNYQFLLISVVKRKSSQSLEFFFDYFLEMLEIVMGVHKNLLILTADVFIGIDFENENEIFGFEFDFSLQLILVLFQSVKFVQVKDFLKNKKVQLFQHVCF